MNFKPRKIIDFLGRFFLASTFAIAIPPKLLRFNDFVNSIVLQGIPEPFAKFLLVCAIFCLVFGVGFLLFSSDLTIGASFLLIFLIPTTLIMHIFPFQKLAVFMNLGLIGALLLALSRSRYSSNVNLKSSFDDLFRTLIKIFKDLLS
tara:strand:+ start:275 stop:715 length:441 start_codon:yes stop_codon:yes gene_type:complete